ncbi:MAG: pyridoxal phosphate-dependent aminotransferase [Bdellovibrionota bacterium]|jgi:alanine-synthesizing transaminase
MSVSAIARVHNPFEWLRVDCLQEFNKLKLKKVYSGEDIIDLSMINPDIEPPRFLLDKLVESSLHTDRHRYAVSRGIRKLREAFAYKYRTVFNVDLDPETDICSVMGSKEGVLNTLSALDSRRSKALLGAPTYSTYQPALDMAGMDYDFFHISDDEGKMLAEIDEMTARQSYAVLLLNFPNNPSGVVVSRKFYDELHELAIKRGFFIINDFVYGEMAYDTGAAESLLATPDAMDHSIEIYSLSKSYSVPGWRVAAALGNPDLIAKLGRLKSRIDYGIFLPIQDAAAAGLTSTTDLTLPIMDKYRRRCRMFVSGLRKIGWNVTMPKAGTSVWAEVPEFMGMSGDDLTYSLLESFNIVALPGGTFGDAYKNFVRFALVASEDKLQKVLDSLSVLSADSGKGHIYANS